MNPISRRMGGVSHGETWRRNQVGGRQGRAVGQGLPIQEDLSPKPHKGKGWSGQLCECCVCWDKECYNPPGDRLCAMGDREQGRGWALPAAVQLSQRGGPGQAVGSKEGMWRDRVTAELTFPLRREHCQKGLGIFRLAQHARHARIRPLCSLTEDVLSSQDSLMTVPSSPWPASLS